MAKKYIKLSKGKLTDSDSSTVAAGESMIHSGHWDKLTEKKAEKELIKILKAEDNRTKAPAKQTTKKKVTE